jgi:hypothetical protein
MLCPYCEHCEQVSFVVPKLGRQSIYPRGSENVMVPAEYRSS